MAMAVRARTFLSKPFFAPRSFSSTPSSSYSSSLIRHRPLAAALSELSLLPAVPAAGVFRGFSTRPTTSSLNDPSPNWSNRPPKETILLDGCDFEHWLIVMEPPEGEPTRDDIIDSYIKTLAEVVGSEEEARMKIYSVSTKHYFAFGALVSEELSIKIKTLPRVRWVLPDSYLDVKNKDYGGEPFINGQAVPYDPKYHEEWVRNNARANERSRRNDRPRNYDRSRNFERRRENMQNRDFQNTAPPSPPRMTAAPGTGGPGGVGMPNAGYPNQGVPPPSTGMPNSGFQNHGTSGPNYQNPGSGGLPNSGYPNQHGMGGVPNPGFQNPNHPGMGGVGNAGFQNPGSAYQNRGMEGPANPGFQKGIGGVPNPGFQNPNHPGIGGVGNSGLQNPGSAYQNRGMDGLANGPHQNQAAGGYPNQGSGFQNQGSYQNQGNFPNQGNYPSPGNYQNQGTGGVPNSGYPNTYVPNRDVSGMPNPNAYQGKDVPGRDAPTMPNRDY